MKYHSAILALIGASFMSFPVAAASDEENVDQIIVTGSRTPISASDVGSAVTIITSDDIARRQVRYVSDLLRAVPGFAVSHTGVVGTQTQVRVRGSEANHVLVLIDGVRANDPATGDEFRWEYLSTANIERIEVVRGPQSALWGSDAIGGVVHILTRAGAGSQGFGAYLEGGSENTLNGAVNGGFGGENWSIGLGIEQLTTDGSNISRVGSEKDDSDVSTISLNARFKPTDAVAMRFGLRSVDAYSQFDTVDFFVTGLPADSDAATDSRQNYAQFGITLGDSGSRIRHHLNTNYFDSDNRDLVDGTETSSAAADRLTIGYQADIGLGNNLLSLGVEHAETSFKQRGAIGFGDPNQDQETDVTSAIADYQGHATDAVTYLISLRYDDNSDFDDSLTGRVSLAWDIADKTTLRGNIGTGQKAPTFTERFGFFPGQFIGNPALKPERSLSYDVGVEQQVGNSARLQFSLFKQDVEDEIDGFAFDPNTFLFTATNLPTKSKRSGVEIGMRWDATEHLGISTTYTYTDASENGSRELRRPRHSGSFQFDYSFMDARGRIALAADYGGTRQDAFFPPWPNPMEIVILSNYWLLDLTGQYDISDTTNLFVRVSNLLDSEYEQVYGYRTPGRATFAGVQVSFGQ